MGVMERAEHWNGVYARIITPRRGAVRSRSSIHDFSGSVVRGSAGEVGCETREGGAQPLASTLNPGEAYILSSLVSDTAHGIASRVLARTAAGNITLFTFGAGEELSEHTAPFDALVLTLSGAIVLTIGGREVPTTADTAVLMPANVPHAVRATESSRMLLIMLREAAP